MARRAHLTGRSRSALLALALVAVTCGGELTIGEYAEQVEDLVVTMNERIDTLGDEANAAPGLDATKRYAAERVDTRYDFIEALDELEPPADAVDLHDSALRIVTRLAEAEALLAARVDGLETNIGIDEIWNTPEGRAARSADQEAIELCLSAQSQLDRTQLRAELGDVPWVPPRMKEVVIVTFGCIAEDR